MSVEPNKDQVIRVGMLGAPMSGGRLLPVTYSLPSAKALLAEIARAYPIGVPMTCQLLQAGLNDTYLVTSRKDCYIARVYHARWRTPSEIAYELELLVHLAAKAVSVALPIADKDGTFSRLLTAPEGPRHLVLFDCARGEPLFWEQEEHSYRAGQLLATIHTASDDFVSRHVRFRCDLDYLIDTPLAAIRPFLTHRPTDWISLEGLAARLRERLAQAADTGLDWGVCHGDLNSGNIHLAEDGTLTVFDFDFCGPGWRAYDIAAAQWVAMGHNKSGIRDAFLKGYTERRRLVAANLAAFPLFHAIRHLWVLGLRAAKATDMGTLSVSGWYLDFELTYLREWEDEHLGAQ
jgi:Ser/Thr protein kinase RdoA (MazF antagonist)